MTVPVPDTDLAAARTALRRASTADETAAVRALVASLDWPDDQRARVGARARGLVAGVRGARRAYGGVDRFLDTFGLSTPEGVALMCLAEALLRVPDAATADRLIADRIGGADWARHLGSSDNWFVNASTWALMLTGQVVDTDIAPQRGLPGLHDLVARLGEPVIRRAVRHAMRVLGRQFVMGRTIGEALDRSREAENRAYRFSFDMLGEAARTAADAERYFDAYAAAIAEIGRDAAATGDPRTAPGISVKLSALHPRFTLVQRDNCLPRLVERLRDLALAARTHGIGLTVDAEEADRLDLSLDIVAAVRGDAALAGWSGFGLAVQAYQKRAPALLDWLDALARTTGEPIAVRLVKGAYWDSEIKWAQERGLAGFPVYTRKASTDVAWLAGAQKLLAARGRLYPQFATHNAHSVAAIIEMAGGVSDGSFEFQRLHGMGEPLYHQIVGPDGGSGGSVEDGGGYPCRVYAPVGSHEDLLPYLVRRLLENGANSSFVHRLRDDAADIDGIVADPVTQVAALAPVPHPKIVLPRDLYRPLRGNSAGIDFGDPLALAELAAALAVFADTEWRAGPLIDGAPAAGAAAAPVLEPADGRRRAGTRVDAADGAVDATFAAARAGFAAWDATPAGDRAAALERAADALEANRAELMALAIREGGKTIPDALAEVREAADFCRYYAGEARRTFAAPLVLPGPTGESNALSLHGRGVFVAISPWNFPLAIFTGQVAAALAAGNAVIAKPAEQTPLIAARAVALLHEAGVPPAALQFVPGPGGRIGAALVGHADAAGIVFTGSTETAQAINRALAARAGPIVPLIAETGGQNAMIVDATALPEQVVDDVLTSAFRSAGQRCSALRVLFVQDDVADPVIGQLQGAAAELVIGDPMRLATDIGPVIDDAARATLQAHADRMAREGRTLIDLALPPDCADGSFFAPKAYEIDALARLDREVFGPILHVIRYEAGKLDAVIDAINAAGYGLTVGVHSRIEAVQRHVAARVRAGNAYVNRSMIGAVVASQPFGGEGLSGTGPKAGGPHYLPRFAVERTLSVNTAAAGGNTALAMLGE
jgi:RHH-type proline utilization regulon transcriptional repressor/proline dehydrogenase/delta 1-pyrroline-5-carboxylate dehydrogenase